MVSKELVDRIIEMYYERDDEECDHITIEIRTNFAMCPDCGLVLWRRQPRIVFPMPPPSPDDSGEPPF